MRGLVACGAAFAAVCEEEFAALAFDADADWFWADWFWAVWFWAVWFESFTSIAKCTEVKRLAAAGANNAWTMRGL